MTFSRALLAAILLLPSAAEAQRRVVSVRDELPPDLAVKDIDRLSPSRIAIERGKDLAITADQMRRLDSASKAYSLHLRDFARPLDTLQAILDRYHKWVVKKAVDRMNANRRDPATDEERADRAREDSVAQAEADRRGEVATAARNELNNVLLTIRSDYDAQIAAANV